MQNIVLDTQSGLNDNDLSLQVEQIRRVRKKRLVVFMFTVFGDESHDEKKQRIFSVAGVIAKQQEWDKLESLWLHRTDGIPFHSGDCEAGRGDYSGIAHENNLELYKDLVQILIKADVRGYANAIDLKAYRAIFPNTIPNTPYYNCFRKVIIQFVKISYLSRSPQKVNCIFDINSQTNASSVELYDLMAKSHQWKYAMEELVGMISFASRKEKIGIQAADLIARETMKHWDNEFHAFNKRPVRKSMQALIDSGKYRFDFYNREYFEGYKDQSGKGPKTAEVIEGLNRWLSKNKMKPSAFNIHKYLQHLQSTDTSPLPIFDFDEDDDEE